MKMEKAVQLSHQSKFKHLQGKVSLWLLIPLIIISALVVSYLLFANSIIKSVAQRNLSEIYGAEVNIGSVNHSLFPLSVAISDIQATDASSPMRNQIAVKEANAEVEFWPLLSGKVIIPNLVVKEATFGTPRSSEGAVYKQPEASAFAFPTLEDLPSVDEVLANTPLQTTKAVEQAKTTYEKYQAPLEEQYAILPSKETLEDYKKQLEQLKNTDFKNPAQIAQATETLKKLKEAFKTDREKIQQFVSLAKTAQADVSQSIKTLRDAPQQDFKLLQGLVAGDAAAINQVTQHLFGDKAELYLEAALMAVELAKGGDAEPEVEVVDDSGIPNLWIKNAELSFALQEQLVNMGFTDITDQHALIGNPTTFLLNASKGSAWDSLNLQGSFEILNGLVNLEQNWEFDALMLSQTALVPESAKQKLTAVLNSGILTTKGGLSVKDNQLDGNAAFNFSNLVLEATGSNDLTSTIASILNQQNALTFDGLFSGTVSDPNINIDSSLDQQLVASLGASLQDNPKLQELKTKLNEKVQSQLSVSNEQMQSISSLLAAANGDDAALKELLEAQIADPKEKLLDKLKGKLFND